MSAPAPAPTPVESQVEWLPTEEDKNLVRKLKGSHTHEMVIGLCGPIGSPTREVALRLQALLSGLYNYKPDVRKLSEFIEAHADPRVDKSTPYKRYSGLINEGNKFKDTYGNSVLAELAIADISIKRITNLIESGGAEYKPERFCHIIDSIKNSDELQAFKAVYGDLFICIGVYASRDERVSRLAKLGLSDVEITDLVDRDSGEEKQKGQSVRNTFHQADFFLNCSNFATDQIDQKLSRILDLVIGSKIITPSPDETAMYTAFTASLNSACLSRQVGAAVTDREGFLLGVGWNDVPRFGGSVYNQSHVPDKRCFNFGNQCYNDIEKDIIATGIANKLLKAGLIVEATVKDAVAVIKADRIERLIEFSRAVHAEMLALLNAGRGGGDRMNGGKIYVTTYPCHSCARHIIAAGIHEVHYIEPYRKSLAIKLHDDALTESATQPGKVKLIPFEGVSPSRYTDFFRMGETPRKREGKLVQEDPKLLNFRAEASLKSLPTREKLVVEKLTKQNLIQPAPPR